MKRVLIVEDSECDFLLMRHALLRSGSVADVVWVQTLAELRQALTGSQWAAVITDHSLHGFTSHAVLELMQQLMPAVPVFLVTGGWADSSYPDGVIAILNKGDWRAVVAALQTHWAQQLPPG